MFMKHPKTVVIAAQVTATRCAEPHHKSLLLAKVLSRDRALSFPFTAFLYSISSTLQFVIKNMNANLKYVYDSPAVVVVGN